MPRAAIQTWAIFVDAYRELNSKRLFWIVLVLSGVVVAASAMVGVGANGLTVLGWETPIPMPFDSPATFYKSLFMGLGFQIWLSWLATILALVSTAGMFVDLVSSGSIELVLSKPIGRLRLFATKYLAGLLFVTAQVTVFSLASFLVLGWRGHAWVPGIFWGVPLVVAFFSYLFCVCVLIGIVTRSTVAALLLTLLVWLSIFVMHMGEGIFLGVSEYQAARVEAIEREITQLETSLAEPAAEEPPSLAGGVRDQFSRAWREEKLTRRREQLPEAERREQHWSRIHGLMYAAMTVLPKTTETVGLLERRLLDATEVEEITAAGDEQPEFQAESGEDEVKVDQAQLKRRIAKKTRERSPWWIVGTSFLFEGAVLGIAAWLFCRRDF